MFPGRWDSDSEDQPPPESLPEFITAATYAVNSSDIVGLFSNAALGTGFDRFFYLKLVPPAGKTRARWQIIEHNCPSDWAETYMGRGDAESDPVLHRSFGTRNPIPWATVLASQVKNARGRAILNERRAAGLHNGISVPIHGPCGGLSVISFAQSQDRPRTPPQEATLPPLAYEFQLNYERLSSRDDGAVVSRELTPRELEILEWFLRGKSNGVIADLLGIAEVSVRFHVRNIYRKLGASCRVTAVLEAIKRGIVHP